MPSYEETGQVDRQAINHFDSDARALIARFHDLDWHSYMSNPGHVFLLAPDGFTTASVSRDSLRGRSGKNAEAALKAWVRKLRDEAVETIKEAHAAEQRLDVGAFGTATDTSQYFDLTIPGHERPVPRAVATRVKKHPVAGPWIESRLRRVGRSGVVELRDAYILYDDEDLDAWVVADVRSLPGGVVAHGPHIGDTEAAFERLTKKEPKLFFTPAKEQDVATKYVCDQCGKTFDTELQVRGHRMGAHVSKVDVVAKTRTCRVCGEVFTAPVKLGAHLRKVHNVVPVSDGRMKHLTVCRWCGKSFKTPQGRGNHERAHEGEPPAVAVTQGAPKKAKPVTRGDVTVTSPDVAEPVTVSTPVLEHLATLPDEGAAADILARVRAIVSPPLHEEVVRLRTERDELRTANELLVKQVGELEARMAILREAMSV